MSSLAAGFTDCLKSACRRRESLWVWRFPHAFLFCFLVLSFPFLLSYPPGVSIDLSTSSVLVVVVVVMVVTVVVVMTVMVVLVVVTIVMVVVMTLMVVVVVTVIVEVGPAQRYSCVLIIHCLIDNNTSSLPASQLLLPSFIY